MSATARSEVVVRNVIAAGGVSRWPGVVAEPLGISTWYQPKNWVDLSE